MVRTGTMDKPLEDSLDELVLSGLDAGLLSDLDGNDMPVDGALDCSNILFNENGSFQSRPGWIRRFKVTMGADIVIDGKREFEDTSRSLRRVVFAGGNMYDCTTMDETGIVTFPNVYLAGRPVCTADMYGELVYSDGVTIGTAASGIKSGCRVYDALAGTDQLLEQSGEPLAIDIPACKAMCVYDSCLILANLLYPDGSVAPESIAWSAVGDIRTFFGTSQRGVAIGDGGQICALQPFTLSTQSVDPGNAFFVGKDAKACFSMRGVVSELQEIRIRASAGVLDAGTVSFIPYSEGGVVIFLGTDKQFYVTNGVTADKITEEKIRKEVATYISDRLSLNPYQRFYAGRNYANNQYVCNLGGGRWYTFDWNKGRWSKLNGWPDGDCLETLNSSRQHQLYILELDPVTNSPNQTVQMCQMNVSRNDNGEDISPYWSSCYFRGGIGQNGENAGSLNKSKLWYFCTLDYATDHGAIKVEFTPDQGEGETQSHVIPAFATNTGAKYDEGVYDTAKYVGGDSLIRKTARFRIPRVNSRGQKSIFRGRDIRVKISLDESTPEAIFQVNSLSLAHTERGMSYV